MIYRDGIGGDLVGDDRGWHRRGILAALYHVAVRGPCFVSEGLSDE